MQREHIVSVDPALCTKCGLCQKDCPFEIIIMTENGAEVTAPKCAKCGHCVAICPAQAVSISGFEDEPEDIASLPALDPEALMAKIKSRRSMRQFTDQEVAPELIEQIIEAGRLTPTARNIQGTSYVVLRDNISEYERIAVRALRRLRPLIVLIMRRPNGFEIGDRFFFKGAPVAIVIKSNSMVDGALAASLMEIMAQSLGLGVLYSGFFTIAAGLPGKIKRKMALARGEKVVTTLVIGHPAVTYRRTAQRESARVIYD